MEKILKKENIFSSMRKELSSAIISDALDKIGVQNRIMRPDLKPIFREAKTAGRAYTVEYANLENPDEYPNMSMREIVDRHIVKDSIIVIGCNQSKRASIWAEMMSIGAMNRGAIGVVADGPVRDVIEMTELQFPVFCTGRTPAAATNRMSVIKHGDCVNCGDLLVKTGDIVFGDYDGIIVIPRHCEEEVLKLAFEACNKEKVLREKLLHGADLMSLD